MGRRRILAILVLVFILSGCSMMTVDKLYQLPKRSETYNNLQSAIDNAMTDLTYCAPLSGENQQTVQIADLDGDGENEYLLFAKGTQEKPLKILVFQNVDGVFTMISAVEANGASYDVVEYVNMDAKPGVEMIVGRQLSDQMLRTATVYTLADGKLNQLVSANYTKFLTTDLNNDHNNELFVLRPGSSETDPGVAELYAVLNGEIVSFNEMTMSQPVNKLKRIITGKLDGGNSAVFVASAVGDSALITDIYTVLDDRLTNVSQSNESNTGIRTMRDFYVFADDVDADGVVELPSLIDMKPLSGTMSEDMHHLIRWYSMTPEGLAVDKMYTYHNFIGGWYMQLDSSWAERLVVLHQGLQTDLYIWNEDLTDTQKLMSIYAFSGDRREENGLSDGRIILHKTESVVYAALLSDLAGEYGYSPENAVYSFRLILKDWKTGET